MTAILDLEDADLDGLDYDLAAEDAKAAFLALLAGIEASGLTHRDYLRAKETLRSHPEVEVILSAADLGIIDDLAALEALRAILGDWGIIPRPDGPGASMAYLEAVQGQPGRRCAWADGNGSCPLPPKPRKGTTGRLPKWCDSHAAAIKKLQDAEASKPREQYKPCCVEYYLDANPDHTGLCPQHRQCKDQGNKPVYPLSAKGSADLSARLRKGWWHLEGRGIRPVTELTDHM